MATSIFQVSLDNKLLDNFKTEKEAKKFAEKKSKELKRYLFKFKINEYCFGY